MKLSADSIWLATAAVDMRTGIDGPSLHVQLALGRRRRLSGGYEYVNRCASRQEATP